MPVQRLWIKEIPADEPPLVLPDGREARGYTLRQMVEKIGGWEGHLEDPLDGSVSYPISLKPWRHRDLDNTFFRIAYTFVDPTVPPLKRA